MATFGDRSAELAFSTRVDGGTTLPVFSNAVQGLGNEPRGGGLADPSHPGHQEGMGQPIPLNRIGERAHHWLLPDKFGEGLRPIFARKHTVGLVGSCRGRCG